MDIAILKKMSVYAAEAKVAELLREDEEPTSTLIKADISLFHQMPEKGLSLKNQDATASDPEVLPPDGANDEPAMQEAIPDPEPAQIIPALSDYERGVEDGKAQSDKVHHDTIKLLQKAVNQMQAEIEGISKTIERNHLTLVSTVLKTVFPKLVELQLEAEISDILTQACKGQTDGEVVLHVNPDDLETGIDWVSSRSLNVSVHVDDELSPQQIKVSWRDGGASIDCRELADTCLARIEEALTELNVSTATETLNG